MTEWRLTLRPGDDALPAAQAVAKAWNVSVPTACMILLREALGFSPRAAQQDCASGVTALPRASAGESGGETSPPGDLPPPPHTPPPPSDSPPRPPKGCDGGCCWTDDAPEHGSCGDCCFCETSRSRPKRKRRPKREPDPSDPVDAAFLRTWDAWREAGGRLPGKKSAACAHFRSATKALGGEAEVESRALEVIGIREPQYLPGLARWLNPKSKDGPGWTDEAMRGERIRAGRQPGRGPPGKATPTTDETAKSMERWT